MEVKRISVRLQRSLLSSVASFLVNSGADSKDILRIVDESVSAARKKQLARNEAAMPYLKVGDLSADLLRAWHRDERYLDSQSAAPRPLSLSKGPRSLRAMALRLNPKADVPALLSFLRSSGLIYKTGDNKYLPATDAGAISRSEGFVAEHVVKSIIRLLETVETNTKFASGFQPLIERFAYVSDLNADEVRSFCEFTKSQGHAYLQLVDDWMEQRRLQKRPRRRPETKKSVLAGIHLIAYLGKGGQKRAPRSVKARLR